MTGAALRIDVLTIFPAMFDGIIGESIIRRAQEKGLVSIRIHDLRAWSADKHKKVDDRPFGGGPGMIMCCQPIFDAIKDLRKGSRSARVIMMSPQGTTLDQKGAARLSRSRHLIMICGRYEGIDERVTKALVDEEISIGDYVVSGGEIPAMVVIDAAVRLVPGVLGNKESVVAESFQDGMLEYPQYTRPRLYRGMRVPRVLLGGEHRKIGEWRAAESLKRTARRDKAVKAALSRGLKKRRKA